MGDDVAKTLDSGLDKTKSGVKSVGGQTGKLADSVANTLESGLDKTKSGVKPR
jgi:hypothetical protein